MSLSLVVVSYITFVLLYLFILFIVVNKCIAEVRTKQFIHSNAINKSYTKIMQEQ